MEFGLPGTVESDGFHDRLSTSGRQWEEEEEKERPNHPSALLVPVLPC